MSTSRQIQHQAYAVVDLDAITENVATLRSMARSGEFMAVLKADAYSHGLVPVANAALRGGASRLGVAVIEEALALRKAGISAPVFTWLVAPGGAYGRAIGENIELAVHSIEQLDLISGAAAQVGRIARVHLKIDTGMGRGGVDASAWPQLCRRACSLEAAGLIQVEGIWSHLACADEYGSATTVRQLGLFTEACDIATGIGLRPAVRHIANSAGTVLFPDSHFDMVRPGLAIYGIDPRPAEMRTTAIGLHPAMSLRARITQVKDVVPGTTVSYGAEYTTTSHTRLAVVPLGYADGIPRSASNLGSVQLAGRRHQVVGRVCMDQLVVDIGDSEVCPGDEVIVFGTGADGEPTAQDWADAAGTIPYEILTRVGGRVSLVHAGMRTFIESSAVRPKRYGREVRIR